MKSLILPAVLIVLALPAAAQTSWSGTGPRGGTYAGSGGCTAGDGSLTCSGASTYTNPFGQTFTRQSNRVATREGVTVNTQITGPAGKTATTLRTRSR